MLPIVSFFGYPTFEAYRDAHVATAHTPGLRAAFSETREQHNARVLAAVGRPGFFDSVIEFVRNEWAKNPNAYRGSSIGWYFHHPETRKLVPADFLAQHDAICGPAPKCYG